MRIAVPEPDLTPDEMVARARGLREVLHERQAECEALGRLPGPTHEAFLAAGFYRVLQPRRYGGYEFDLPTFLRVIVELAWGCPASGWVYALTAGHTHTLAAFSERAQSEVYGDANGDVRIPLVAAPVRAMPADGGFRVTGSWDYASGSDLATHFIGGLINFPEMFFAVISRDSFRVENNWDPLGMRGTASRRVIVEDVFVPLHRTRPLPSPQRDQMGPTPHKNPLYAGGAFSLLFSELAAVAVGIARCAVDRYAELLAVKPVFGDPLTLRRDSSEYQRYLGRAIGLTDTADATLTQVGQAYMAAAHRVADGAEFDEEADRRLILMEQMVVRLATEAVEMIFRTAGAGSTRNGEEIQRLYRDVSMIPTHVGMQYERTMENVGRLRLGVPVDMRL